MNSFIKKLMMATASNYSRATTNAAIRTTTITKAPAISTTISTSTVRNAKVSGMFPLWLAIIIIVCILANADQVSGRQVDQLAKRDFELIMENFTCGATPSASQVVKTAICGLGKNSKRRTLQMEMAFLRDLSDFEMEIIITLPRKNEDFLLLNLSNIVGCDFLANRKQVTLIHLGRTNLNRYSNFPNHCPFRNDTVYYIRGFRWDMEMLPSLTIETRANVWFNYYAEGQKIIAGFVSCRLAIKTARKEQLTSNLPYFWDNYKVV